MFFLAKCQFKVPSLNLRITKKQITAKKYRITAIIKGGIVAPPTSSETNHRPKGHVNPQIIVVKISNKYAVISCFLLASRVESTIFSLVNVIIYNV